MQSHFITKKKCVVITTINDPTPQVVYYSNIPDWDIIIVGDSKTIDDSYKTLKCIYLGLQEQKELFPSLYEKIPLKSYCRKMFGYLYAIKNKYDIIYDTDDDNQYIGDLNSFNTETKVKKCDTRGFVNLYNCFTDELIWPRGIPPQHPSIRISPELSDSDSLPISVIQGLVNNDPDVDAYYRINVRSEPFNFDKTCDDIALAKGSVCPFNTQNTFWIDSSMFYAMYLPVSVTFRYTDILRGFVALFQLWKNDKTIKFTNPTAVQLRNEHDLNKDYESEVTMYETAEKVIELLNNNMDATIQEMYSILCDARIVDETELAVLEEWMRLID